jgi:hypothetical protein
LPPASASARKSGSGLLSAREAARIRALHSKLNYVFLSALQSDWPRLFRLLDPAHDGLLDREHLAAVLRGEFGLDAAACADDLVLTLFDLLNFEGSCGRPTTIDSAAVVEFLRLPNHEIPTLCDVGGLQAFRKQRATAFRNRTAICKSKLAASAPTQSLAHKRPVPAAECAFVDVPAESKFSLSARLERAHARLSPRAAAVAAQPGVARVAGPRTVPYAPPPPSAAQRRFSASGRPRDTPMTPRARSEPAFMRDSKLGATEGSMLLHQGWLSHGHSTPFWACF